MRTVAVTGANGFIGGRLCAHLSALPSTRVLPLTRADGETGLRAALADADAIAHMAGVTRPPRPDEFDRGNRRLTERLAALVRAGGTAPLILFASSVHAAQDTEYGRTKRAAEDVLFALGARIGARIAVFRLPQVFGRGARPHYNAISATLLADAAAGVPTEVRHPGDALELVDVADAVRAMAAVIADPPASSGFVTVGPAYSSTVGDVGAIAARFSAGATPDPASPLERALFDAFLGYRALLT